MKFANNEPFRPFFKDSQINIFAEDNRGDGIQHSALTVKDIVSSVRGLRAAGVEFMPTPALLRRAAATVQQIGIGSIDESIDVLRELEILVDGQQAHSYLLQIFLKEAAGLYHVRRRGRSFSRSSSAKAIRVRRRQLPRALRGDRARADARALAARGAPADVSARQ